MATLCIYHQYLNRNSLIHGSNLIPTKIKTFKAMVCLSQLPLDQIGLESRNGEKGQKGIKSKEIFLQIFQQVEKMGKRWLWKEEENLNPKQNGDWKDVMLMSLSFAVYVYISQKIVCAYCAWVSMANHPW